MDWQQKKAAVVAAALLLIAAFGGWGSSSVFFIKAAAVEETTRSESIQKYGAAKLSLDKIRATLIGTYEVTGTDPDGIPYIGRHLVTVSLAPSGALELEWDKGRNFGVGHVFGDVLAVASWAKDRTVIMTLKINSDGSLSGKWSRRTDHGSQATEKWVKASP